MPCPFLIVSQSDYFIQIVDINSHTEWRTVQIQISWLLQKPTDLDLHCLQRQGVSGFSRTRVKHQLHLSRAMGAVMFMPICKVPSNLSYRLPILSNHLCQKTTIIFQIPSKVKKFKATCFKQPVFGFVIGVF